MSPRWVSDEIVAAELKVDVHQISGGCGDFARAFVAEYSKKSFRSSGLLPVLLMRIAHSSLMSKKPQPRCPTAAPWTETHCRRIDLTRHQCRRRWSRRSLVEQLELRVEDRQAPCSSTTSEVAHEKVENLMSDHRFETDFICPGQTGATDRVVRVAVVYRPNRLRPMRPAATCEERLLPSRAHSASGGKHNSA